MSNDTKRVLAVASKGGHWRQMSAIASAFEDYEVGYVSTSTELGDYCVRDCSRSQWWYGLVTFWQLAIVFARVRPEVVISTGALPGLLALIVGWAFGARTIWIDSIANADGMSLSGRLSRPFAELWLTQWPGVSERSGAAYAGAVL